MKLENTAVLLTGAASGIGRATALALAREGARLALVDRDARGLDATCASVRDLGAEVHTLVADLSDLDGIPAIVARAAGRLGRLDVLINNAGLVAFRALAGEETAALRRLHTVNVLAPTVLCREALTLFRRQGHGRIVNVGSIFGSIGFAWFASYSATKFALRGLSEALRRELAGTGISVTYVAPRATRTTAAGAFGAMADAVGMTMDDPGDVAARIVRAIRRDARDRYLGFPEALFVRINALLPRLVDIAVRKQDRAARPFAEDVGAIAGRSGPLRATAGAEAGDDRSTGSDTRSRSEAGPGPTRDAGAPSAADADPDPDGSRRPASTARPLATETTR